MNSRKILKWLLISAGVVAVAFMVPKEAFERFSGVFGVEHTASPFDDKVAQTDRALAHGFDVYVSESELLDLLPQIQIRRLAANGPIASDEIPKLIKVLEFYRPATINGEYKSAERNLELGDVLKRWERAAIELALRPLDEEVRRLAGRFQPEESACVECHTQTIVAPGGAIDVVGIWPFLDAETLDFGKQIPILSDSLEMKSLSFYMTPDLAERGPFANSKEMLGKGCLDCHGAHGAEGFEVDLQLRQDNIGFWVKSYTLEGALHVQTKIQNLLAAHYVPGGWAHQTYLVTVEAWHGDQELRAFHGPELPNHLLEDGRPRSGRMLGRFMVDEAGNPTSDFQRTHDVLWDTRLEARRFEDAEFIFPLDDGASYRVVARVIFLPFFTTWDHAQDVEVRILP